ncbi:DNA polymerase III subunit gamma/tau [Patescibacteria group bacterium]|nr:MAG: DNA polymerase III subunit gamma/tau [Patescibacteria group bacterium]
MSEALYRTYRPTCFDEVVGQDHVKTTLRNEVVSGKVAHAYLFTGPRGVGKTTIARILAKAVNCLASKGGEPCNACESCQSVAAGSAMDVLEIDAATHTGVDNIRETVIEAVRFAPNRLKRRVYVIDEVHMLSAGSFNALLKTLEEPPAHAVFILATTEIHKVPATVISRCERFDFRRIPVAELVETLRGIAKKEGVEVEEAVLAAVARHAEGGLRDAESLLGQLFAIGGKKVGMEEASLVLPATNALAAAELVEHVVKRDAASAVALVGKVAEQGVDLPHFAADVVDALRALLHASLGDAQALPSRLDHDSAGRLTALLGQTNPRAIAVLIDRFEKARRQSKGESIPSLPLEIAIVESCVGEADKASGGQGPQGSADFRRTRVGSVRLEGGVKAVGDKAEGNVEVQTISVSDSPVLRPSTPDALPPSPPTALGTVPVLSIDQVKAKWPDVFQLVKAANASLPVVLRTGEISRVDGDRIEISFAYSLHADTLNTVRNRLILDPVLERVYGARLHLHGTYARATDPDEAVDLLLEEFGGSAA